MARWRLNIFLACRKWTSHIETSSKSFNSNQSCKKCPPNPQRMPLRRATGKQVSPLPPPSPYTDTDTDSESTSAVAWLGVIKCIHMNAIKFIVRAATRRLPEEQQEKLIPKHLLAGCLGSLSVCPSVPVSVCPYVRPAAREIAHAYANMSQLSFQLKLVHCTFILVAGQIKNKNKPNERRACVGREGQGRRGGWAGIRVTSISIQTFKFASSVKRYAWRGPKDVAKNRWHRLKGAQFRSLSYKSCSCVAEVWPFIFIEFLWPRQKNKRISKKQNSKAATETANSEQPTSKSLQGLEFFKAKLKHLVGLNALEPGTTRAPRRSHYFHNYARKAFSFKLKQKPAKQNSSTERQKTEK